MAKLPRVFQFLFGNSGDQSHFEQFGARAAGPANFTKDPNTIQSLAAFLTGWTAAVNPTNNAPFLEDMNGLFLLIFRQIGYLFQEGMPEWDSSTTYYTGSIVKKTGTTELYGSLVDNNTGNALPSQTSNGFWNYLNPQTVAPGVISDYGGTSAPFGWLSCDGSVVAQGSYPALFTAIGSTWNTGGEGAGNFRLPDLRGRTTIGAGTGSGLTPRTVGQESIGEETHTLVVGEIPANLNVVNPTINGSVTGHSVGLAVAAGGNGPFLQTDNSSYPISASNSGGSVGGGGGAHNNMQPSAVALKIIKT